jgi:hypothetical protein
MSIQEMLERFGTFRRIFHFNHIDPAKKAPNYDNLIQRVISEEQLDELDKCALLCVTCHGALHAQNLNVSVTVTLRTEGFETTQTFDCQVIHDRSLKRIMLLCDQLDHLFLYRVQLGRQEPEIYSGLQLHNTLGALIRETRQEETLTIDLLDGFPMLRVKKLNDQRYEMKPDLRFPLVKGYLNLTPAIAFHFRNGSMLTNLDSEVGYTADQVEPRMEGKYDAIVDITTGTQPGAGVSVSC